MYLSSATRRTFCTLEEESLARRRKTRRSRPGPGLHVTANDSPAAITAYRHPDPNRGTLIPVDVDWEMCFSSYLCVYSKRAGKVIAVVMDVGWTVKQQAHIDWTGVVPLPLPGPNGALQGKKPNMSVRHVTIAALPGAVNALTPAVATNLEIGLPGLHSTQGDDARA